MSDTITYNPPSFEIPIDGNCYSCPNRKETMCEAFGQSVLGYAVWIQCEKCVAFLENARKCNVQ
jgi:hypothetical protein